jgi:hypothetical protein
VRTSCRTLAIAAMLLVAVAPVLASPAGAATTHPSKSTTTTALAKKLTRLNAQYRTLARRTRTCAVGKADRARAARLRTAALRRAVRPKGRVPLSVKALRTRNARLARALRLLKRSGTRCTATSPARTTPGRGDGSGPGPPNGAVPGAPSGSSFTLPVGLANALGRSPLDLPAALSTLPAPEDMSVVDVARLADPACQASGGSLCVGINPDGLITRLEEIITSHPLLTTLTPTLPALLEQVRTAAHTSVSSLFTLQPAGGRALRLVPAGPLAPLATAMAGVLTLPSDAIGQVRGTLR